MPRQAATLQLVRAFSGIQDAAAAEADAEEDAPSPPGITPIPAEELEQMRLESLATVAAEQRDQEEAAGPEVDPAEPPAFDLPALATWPSPLQLPSIMLGANEGVNTSLYQ